MVAPDLIIRSDAIPHIGIGHLMRCLALAQAWQDRGGQTAFVTCCNSAPLVQRIRQEGISVKLLNQPHPDPTDLEETLEYLARVRSSDLSRPLWVVLDGYHFDLEYQSALRELDLRLLVIDDMGHYPVYSADILLNPNIHATSLRYNLVQNAQILAGTRYALIRREFLASRVQDRLRTDPARRILVTMGGSDPDNVTLRIIKALRRMNDPHMEVRTVVGPVNTNRITLARESKGAVSTFQVLPSVKDMASLMIWADAAVTAGGSTCYELAFLGVPFLIVVLAENQEPGAAGFEKEGVAVNLGWHTSINVEEMVRALESFLLDPERRHFFSDRGRRLVDGRGAERVLERMYRTPMKLRSARIEDCKMIWKWANDPFVRQVSFNSDPIPWGSHRAWFKTKIADPSCLFYIATVGGGRAVGQARFDINGDKAIISVSLSARYRGFGWGSKFILQASQQAIAERGIATIDAWVLTANTASILAFEKAGYQKIEETVRQGCPSVCMRYRRGGGK